MPATTKNTAPSTSRPADSPRIASGTSSDLHPVEDFVEYVRTYAQERPDVAALWCFGIGFVVGWKLKPW